MYNNNVLCTETELTTIYIFIIPTLRAWCLIMFIVMLGVPGCCKQRRVKHHIIHIYIYIMYACVCMYVSTAAIRQKAKYLFNTC